MNKGGSVGGTGPTAAAAASAAQKQKALLQRVETDVSSLVDNFANLVNASRVCLHLLFSLANGSVFLLSQHSI